MKLFLTFVIFICVQQNPSCFAKENPVSDLKAFLNDHAVEQVSNQEFASIAVSREQAKEATEILVAARLAELKDQRRQEWKDRAIKLDNHSMKFQYRVFGDKPDSGRSLFISMHGGGGAPAKVNDQQWKNQIRLYEPSEGVYLAPRAPTNTWNLWHQEHIDTMFARIIENAILFEDVDPNRVYLLGYSAGGDGAYQLAPRMADQLAAAAMMAGHPNDAKPFGLRNIGFTIHMGGKDKAYGRNKVAMQWKKWLAELKTKDLDGYPHEVVIHEKHGHWMHRDDAVALDWMSKFTRTPFPEKVVWYQSGVTRDRFYWLAVDDENEKPGTHVSVIRNGQEFLIEKAEGAKAITICLSDEMANLDQPIRFKIGEKTVERNAVRTIKAVSECLLERADPKMVFSAEIKIDLEELP